MKKPKFIPEFDDIPTPRAKMPELPLESREGSFGEVELGLTQELALAEASRCLSCRRCIGCGLCLAECDPQAIVYDQAPETRKLRFDAVLLAAGCGSFDATSKPALAYGTGANVVTTVELERMLSPTGPYGGLALRPGDGVPPRRVAFIQCVGSREEGIGANYCSTSCCNAALRLTDQLVGRGVTDRVTLFHRGMRPFGRRGETLYRRACDADQVSFVFAEVKSVVAGDCTEPVSVVYDAGEGDATEAFDLVVLSIGSRASSAARAIARRVRAPFNKFGYVAGDLFRPVPVGVEGVPVAGGLTGPVDVPGALAAAHAAASAATGDLGMASEEPDAGRDAAGARSAEAAGNGPAVVAVCRYGLRERGLDTAQIESSLGDIAEAAGSVRADLACAPGAVAEIADAIEEHGASRVLVVGCHPATHRSFWDAKLSRLGGSPAADLVEVGPDASATMENVRGSLSAEPYVAPAAPREVERRILVVGSGAAGLAAAEEAARRGVPVTLVTRDAALGGRHAGRHSLIEGLREGIDGLVERVGSDPAIDALLESEIAGVEEAPGGFVTTVAGPSGESSVRHGAALVAIEAPDHDPTDCPGRDEARVLTQSELAGELVAGPTDARDIVMVQCVGSRTPERPYCSRVCCAEAMANALRIKEGSADAEVTVLHRGIRVWGFDEEMFADAVDLGVRFIEVEGSPAVAAGGGLEVTAERADGGGAITLKPDLVVLSTGVRPSGENEGVAASFGLALDADGFFAPIDEALRPVETERPGVFVCGSACWPASVREAVTQGRAAAGRACLFLRGG